MRAPALPVPPQCPATRTTSQEPQPLAQQRSSSLRRRMGRINTKLQPRAILPLVIAGGEMARMTAGQHSFSGWGWAVDSGVLAAGRW
jgi:hypothetical protein